MPNLKEVRNRISSTQSTRQITKAMKLVSATKLRKAQEAITKMRPYAEKLSQILANLKDSVKENEELLRYFEKREVRKVLLVAISSDRGLAGAFNANIIKTTKRLLGETYKHLDVETDVEILYVGKKAYEILKNVFQNPHNTEHMDLFTHLDAEQAFALTDMLIQKFLRKEVDAVLMVYNSFKNAATQMVRTETLLPIQTDENEQKGAKNEYIFEPDRVGILEDLIPRSVKTQFFKALLDSSAGEHGARMVAMDKATENAGELLNNLKLQYNQARQAAITNEILEIVGGAAALDG